MFRKIIPPDILAAHTEFLQKVQAWSFFWMFLLAYVIYLQNKDSYSSLGDSFSAFLFWGNSEFCLTNTTTVSTGVIWIYFTKVGVYPHDKAFYLIWCCLTNQVTNLCKILKHCLKCNLMDGCIDRKITVRGEWLEKISKKR